MPGRWPVLLGHSSIAISARYVHPSEEALLTAVERLGGHKTGHGDGEVEKRAEDQKLLSGTHD
jgi:hypothetical protein